MSDYAPLAKESAALEISDPNQSWLQDAWRRFKENRPALFCLWILGLLAFFALIGPLISSHSYYEIHLNQNNQPPCRTFWFGSDDLGRDIFCRVFWGARISLMIGFCAAIIDAFIGVLWGATAAWFGGWIDELMMRFCDILYTIPTILVILLLSLFIGTGPKTVLLAIVLFGWINMARIIRAQILQIKESDYVLAARAAGASSSRIIARHLVPNAIGPILATATLTIPSAIFVEAFLSFLGFGIQPPAASWGIMINEGIGAMQFYPWRLFFPSAILTLTMLCFNLAGNALRDALDPRLRS